MTLICHGMDQSKLRITIWPGFLQTHQGPQHQDHLFYLDLTLEAQQQNLVRRKPPVIKSPGSSPPSVVKS